MLMPITCGQDPQSCSIKGLVASEQLASISGLAGVNVRLPIVLIKITPIALAKKLQSLRDMITEKRVMLRSGMD